MGAKKNVDIYIHADARVAAEEKKGHYIYLIEFKLKNGLSETRTGVCEIENATNNKLTLTACIEALERMTEPVRALIHMDNLWISNITQSGCLTKWKDNGYQNSKGNIVENVELWKRLNELSEKHTLSFSYEPKHEYELIMKNELKKWLKDKERFDQ